MANTINTTPNVLIKLPVVKQRTCLSTSEIYRRLEDGTFPRQIKLGSRAVAWLESDIAAWVDARVAESLEGV